MGILRLSYFRSQCQDISISTTPCLLLVAKSRLCPVPIGFRVFTASAWLLVYLNDVLECAENDDHEVVTILRLRQISAGDAKEGTFIRRVK